MYDDELKQNVRFNSKQAAEKIEQKKRQTSDMIAIILQQNVSEYEEQANIGNISRLFHQEEDSKKVITPVNFIQLSR